MFLKAFDEFSKYSENLLKVQETSESSGNCREGSKNREVQVISERFREISKIFGKIQDTLKITDNFMERLRNSAIFRKT